MKPLYLIVVLALCQSTLIPASAQLLYQPGPDADYRQKKKKFLPKKETPVSWEVVIGGQGEFAHTRNKTDKFSPYGQFAIGARVYTNHDRVYGTQGIGGGKFAWENFEVKVTGGSLDLNDGLLSSRKVRVNNPYAAPNFEVKLEITCKEFPNQPITKIIPLDFNISPSYRSSGSTGQTGWQAREAAYCGQKGHDNIWQGENGEHGGNGQDGGNGGAGGRGPDLDVYLRPMTHPRTGELLIEAEVQNRSYGTSWAAWFKAGNRLTVFSQGGQGGCGGQGQAGGNGGNGGEGGQKEGENKREIKADGGHAGRGGQGGNGGNGGIGGQGGNIRVYYHPSLKQYLPNMTIQAKPGRPGPAGEGGLPGDGGRGGYGTDDKGRCGKDGSPGASGQSGQWGSWGTVTYFQMEIKQSSASTDTTN